MKREINKLGAQEEVLRYQATSAGNSATAAQRDLANGVRQAAAEQKLRKDALIHEIIDSTDRLLQTLNANQWRGAISLTNPKRASDRQKALQLNWPQNGAGKVYLAQSGRIVDSGIQPLRLGQYTFSQLQNLKQSLERHTKTA